MTADPTDPAGVPEIDDWNRLLDGRVAVVDYLRGYEDYEALWEAWAPAGRLGWPADQARVALFLASDLSSFVTGHNIPVDGGTKAGGGWFYSPTAGRFVNRPTTL